MYSILQRIWLSNLLCQWPVDQNTLIFRNLFLFDKMQRHNEILDPYHKVSSSFWAMLCHGDLRMAGWLLDLVTFSGTALEDLRSSHANLSTRKSSLDSHHANLKDCRSEEFFAKHSNLTDELKFNSLTSRMCWSNPAENATVIFFARIFWFSAVTAAQRRLFLLELNVLGRRSEWTTWRAWWATLLITTTRHFDARANLPLLSQRLPMVLQRLVSSLDIETCGPVCRHWGFCLWKRAWTTKAKIYNKISGSVPCATGKLLQVLQVHKTDHAKLSNDLRAHQVRWWVRNEISWDILNHLFGLVVLPDRLLEFQSIPIFFCKLILSNGHHFEQRLHSEVTLFFR